MEGSVVAGVDCSTQATKVLLISVDDGSVIASGRAAHEVTGGVGASETHPDVWWHALREALAETGRADEVAAIAVGAQQHGLVVRDGAGQALHPAVLWNDVRSATDARALVADLGGPKEWVTRVASVPVAAYTVSKWAWLRRTSPELLPRVRAVALPHDHLTWRLTGEHVTDRGDASGTGWWSPADGAYDPDILRLPRVALDVDLLPRVLGPREVAGEVTSSAAAELGLRPGTLVGPGTGDNMAAALGLGLPPGIPVMSLGTSGTVYAVSHRAAADVSGMVSGFADATGAFLPLACTLNCTLAVDRVATWLGLQRDEVDAGGEVVFLPFLDGERTPNLPEASGTVTGLRHDTTAGQILRAAYEGAVATLLDALQLIDEHSSGITSDAPLVLIGGGARGRVWQDVVGRLSGRPLQVPEAQEHVAIGAAVQAAAVLTGEEPTQIAQRWGARAGRTVGARPRDTETIDRIRRFRSDAAPVLQCDALDPDVPTPGGA